MDGFRFARVNPETMPKNKSPADMKTGQGTWKSSEMLFFRDSLLEFPDSAFVVLKVHTHVFAYILL